MKIAPLRKQVRQTAIRSQNNPPPIQVETFPAPTLGWVTSLPLMEPSAKAASVLENWFPTQTGIRLRSGSVLYATIGEDPVTSLFTYRYAGTEKFFAADAENIFEITTPADPEVAPTAVITGQTSGDYSAVPFQTTAGGFLYLFNGDDAPLLYDGTDFTPITSKITYALPYDAETGTFTVGLEVTGGTSTATATIVGIEDNGTDGTLYVQDITGTFQNNEAITDSSTGVADADLASPVAASQPHAITFTSDTTGTTTADLKSGFAYKNRLFMIKTGTMTVWYLPVYLFAGAANSLELSGVFRRGGSLLFGATWSQDSGNGPDDLAVFVTDQGEFAVYTGTDPSDAAAWSFVGRYDIGKPLGKNAYINIGGDLLVATEDGVIALSAATTKDPASLSLSAATRAIEPDWKREAVARRTLPWSLLKWPSKNMAIVGMPVVDASTDPDCLVANLETGAWAKYTGWDARSLGLYADFAYFGTSDGKVYLAESTGYDGDQPYEARYCGLYKPYGRTVSCKTARAILRAGTVFNAKVSLSANYETNFPTPPDAAVSTTTAALWGSAIWGTSVWGGGSDQQITVSAKWSDVSKTGFAIAPQVQVTTGSAQGPNVELVSVDMTLEAGNFAV